MRKPIDGARVKALRERQKLSQKELAERAKISPDSLSRIERNCQTGKARNTAEGLCRALEVSAEVLTGEAPMPEVANAGPSGDRYQMNVRVDGAVRNAFSLAAMRYKIPVSQIIELAPFLFVVAAEKSLRRRSASVAELESAIDKALDLGNASQSYLLRHLAIDMGHQPQLDAERVSIASRDILAERLNELAKTHSIFGYSVLDEDYDDPRDNPFVQSLRESAADLDVATINRLWRDETDYCICWTDAVEFAGGDEDIARMIVDGSILIRDVPADLCRTDAADRRKTWLQGKAAEIRAAYERGKQILLDLIG